MFGPNDIQTNKKLCFMCRRKVGLLGFECKCDFVFCSKHRYAEDHGCTHDYRAEAAKKLEKENPLVVGAKLTKI